LAMILGIDDSIKSLIEMFQEARNDIWQQHRGTKVLDFAVRGMTFIDNCCGRLWFTSRWSKVVSCFFCIFLGTSVQIGMIEWMWWYLFHFDT
jgi:hypothetical protein